MKVAAFIPARFASTRLPGKPLADICGKPMIQRVYERAKAARLVEEVIVATDDIRIFNVVKACGGTAIMTSPDHASGTDRIAEAAKAVKASIIVNIQGDEPLIEPDMIDSAIRPLIDDKRIKICTLKTKITSEHEYNDPNAVKVVTDKDGWALYFSRSPLPYYRAAFNEGAEPYKHIGLYVYTKAFLENFAKLEPTPLEQAERLEQLRAIENGFKIKVVETPFNPVSVDTDGDLKRVREIISRA
ncbi:3-deoxy-manno-octulosonate cytidylyltransferase [bacterium]|nr:MAG: 3-deoxy-manno-octulosonate cytidylyltransferase [bacterium]